MFLEAGPRKLHFKPNTQVILSMLKFEDHCPWFTQFISDFGVNDSLKTSQNIFPLPLVYKTLTECHLCANKVLQCLETIT